MPTEKYKPVKILLASCCARYTSKCAACVYYYMCVMWCFTCVIHTGVIHCRTPVIHIFHMCNIVTYSIQVLL